MEGTAGGIGTIELGPLSMTADGPGAMLTRDTGALSARRGWSMLWAKLPTISPLRTGRVSMSISPPPAIEMSPSPSLNSFTQP